MTTLERKEKVLAIIKSDNAHGIQSTMQTFAFYCDDDIQELFESI